MSREEAIKKMRLLMHKDIIEMSTVEYCELMNKAISDMQKLEKIEETLKEYQDGKDVFSGMDESYVVGKIEQIVKEVE